MADFPWGPLYHLSDNNFWPGLTRQQRIPDTLRARAAVRPSAIGLGMVKAVCAALTDGWLVGLGLEPASAHWTARVVSRSQVGVEHVLGGDPNTWWIPAAGYLAGIAVLLDVLLVQASGVVTPDAPLFGDFMQRWNALLQILQQEMAASPPYHAPALARIALPASSRSPAPPRLALASEAMMAATDALYFLGKRRAATTLGAVVWQGDPHPVASQPGLIARAVQAPGGVLGLHAVPHAPVGAGTATAPGPAAGPAPGTPPADGLDVWGAVLPGLVPSSDLNLVATLRLAVREGMTVLLFGATGVGKSRAARLAAQEEGVRWVKLEGMPGLTDRQLFVNTVATVDAGGQQRYVRVDGPLPAAWRLAEAGTPAVLIIDELARFDPYHLSPLLGALDVVRGEEVALLAGIKPQVRAALDARGKYRILTLPDGERLVAEARLLPVLATTNLGVNFVQAQQDFDEALLRRFAWKIQVRRLPARARRAILTRQLGLPGPVAEVLVAVEDASTRLTAAHNGLLRFELNLGTLLNWGHLAGLYHAQRRSWADAVLAAADLTALPQVCPRDTAGELEEPAANALRDVIREMIAAARRLPAS